MSTENSLPVPVVRCRYLCLRIVPLSLSRRDIVPIVPRAITSTMALGEGAIDRSACSTVLHCCFGSAVERLVQMGRSVSCHQPLLMQCSAVVLSVPVVERWQACPELMHGQLMHGQQRWSPKEKSVLTLTLTKHGGRWLSLISCTRRMYARQGIQIADGRDVEATTNHPTPTEFTTNRLVPEVKGRGRAGNDGQSS